MYRFKKGTEDILVATDIAARGTDVPEIGHIINYDVPFDGFYGRLCLHKFVVLWYSHRRSNLVTEGIAKYVSQTTRRII